MSYYNKMLKGKTGMVVKSVGETLAYGAASYGFGFVQNKYREKASVKGIPVDLFAGVGLKALALGTQLLTKHGDSMAVQGMDLVANAGVGAFFHTLGAGHGAKSAGVTRFMTTASADKVKAALPGVTILGEIPQAPAGNFLSARDLAAMAAR